MAQARFPPAQVVTSNNYSSAPIDAVRDDPDNPDGQWWTWDGLGNTNANVRVYVAAGPPPLLAGVGLQEFRALIRKTEAGGSDTNWALRLRQAGAIVRILATGTATSTTGEVISGTWDAAELAPTGSVQLDVLQTSGGGTGTPRGIEIGAAVWIAEVDPAGISWGSGALPSGPSSAFGGGASGSSGGGGLASGPSSAGGVGASGSAGGGQLLSGPSTASGAGASGSSGSGDLVSGSASLAGGGGSGSSGGGALVSGAASLSGAGTSGSTGTGALSSSESSVAGDGASGSSGSGHLVSGPSTVSGEGTATQFGNTVDLFASRRMPLEFTASRASHDYLASSGGG